jgi:hypothetical protein
MCLDPRPESLVRPRRASRRRVQAVVSPAPRREAERATERERWLATLTDGLDARGWSLVTRPAPSR